MKNVITIACKLSERLEQKAGFSLSINICMNCFSQSKGSSEVWWIFHSTDSSLQMANLNHLLYNENTLSFSMTFPSMKRIAKKKKSRLSQKCLSFCKVGLPKIFVHTIQKIDLKNSVIFSKKSAACNSQAETISNKKKQWESHLKTLVLRWGSA